MKNKDEIMNGLIDLLAQPYNVRNAVDIYKALHEYMDIGYISQVDYALFVEVPDLDLHMKTPLQLTAAICMKEFRALVAAMVELHTEGRSSINDVNIEDLADCLVSLTTYTLFQCCNKLFVDEESYQNTVKHIGGKMGDNELRIASTFEQEIHCMIRSIGILVSTFYGDEVGNRVKSGMLDMSSDMANLFLLPLSARKS